MILRTALAAAATAALLLGTATPAAAHFTTRGSLCESDDAAHGHHGHWPVRNAFVRELPRSGGRHVHLYAKQLWVSAALGYRTVLTFKTTCPR